MLQDSDLTEIEVTEGEEAVRISRNSGNIQSVRETLSQATEHSEKISVSKNESKSEDVGKKITSPIKRRHFKIMAVLISSVGV